MASSNNHSGTSLPSLFAPVPPGLNNGQRPIEKMPALSAGPKSAIGSRHNLQTHAFAMTAMTTRNALT
jgi:hypothetical protein